MRTNLLGRMKHGEKRRRRWKKLHVGVDGSGWILASMVTDNRDPDPSQVPGLLAQVEREIDRFVADGIYDQEPVYAALEQHSPGVTVIIPPRKDAAGKDQAPINHVSRLTNHGALERRLRAEPRLLFSHGLASPSSGSGRGAFQCWAGERRRQIDVSSHIWSIFQKRLGGATESTERSSFQKSTVSARPL
jgi:hypothetical protein